MKKMEIRKKLEMWDAHLEMKNPDFKEAWRVSVLEPFRAKIQSLGYDECDLNDLADKAEGYWRQRQIDHYSQFDLSILDELDLTLDDILELKQEKRKRAVGAGNRPNTVDQQKPAFIRIVIQCEAERLNFAQTLKRLTKELGATERTLRTWLTALSDSPNCDIPPPRRIGRG